MKDINARQLVSNKEKVWKKVSKKKFRGWCSWVRSTHAKPQIHASRLGVPFSQLRINIGFSDTLTMINSFPSS